METKTCKECGRELPITHFRRIRDGVICAICKDCTNAKMRATKASKSLKMGEGGGKLHRLRIRRQKASRSHRLHDTGQTVA